MPGRLDLLACATLAGLAGAALYGWSPWLAVIVSTVLGILGSMLVAKPFFRVEELKQALDLLSSLRPGNPAARRVREAMLSGQKLKLEGLDLGDRLWMLRGLALLAASYLFSFLAFVLSQPG